MAGLVDISHKLHYAHLCTLQAQMLLEVVDTARKKLRGHSYYE